MTKSKAPSRSAAAPMSKGKAKSGGGIAGNKVVRPKPVAGRDNRAVNPGGADQLGAATANKRSSVPLMGGPGYKPNVSDGNYLAFTTECKPGGSRTTYPSGFQSLHGKPVQAERDTGVDVPAKGMGKAPPLDERRERGSAMKGKG
jgi:hypothetical protein